MTYLGIILGLICLCGWYRMKIADQVIYCQHFDRELQWCPYQKRECLGLELMCKDVKI